MVTAPNAPEVVADVVGGDELAGAEAVVKSARAKASAVRTQADLIRSIGLSVRTSMEVG